MTQVRAQLSSLRIAPRKVRLLADLIKGMEVQNAEEQLAFQVKRGALPLSKLLKSAIANARNNTKIDSQTPLYVRDIQVNEGRVFKRFMPRARGRASLIRKKTSHISLVLDTEKK